jgi:hypothetical protein
MLKAGYYEDLFPILCGFAHSTLEAPLRVAGGASCQRDASDTPVPRDPTSSSVSSLHLTQGLK